MSDGSSATQIGGISDREVAIVDSFDSIATTNSDEDDGGSSDWGSSDIGSSYISDQDDEGPISIVTNIRPSPPAFHPEEDEEEEEVEIEEKSPAGGRIAKDTGCCLYSAITAIFVMVVLIGIVLIVTGPVLGLSFPPLLRANTPVILPPMEHNYLTANFSDEVPAEVDQDVIHSDSQPEADYAEQYDPGDGSTNQTADSFEYVDYLEDVNQPPANLSDFLAVTLNRSAGMFNESVIEDLANLSPEALRTKYVAYVPIPLKIDDDDDQEQSDYHQEEVDDAGVSINDRNDNHYNQEEDIAYYEEEMATPRSSSAVRRRPTIEKVLLPIVMVPESSDVREAQRTQTSREGSDAWRSSEYSEDRSSNPPRRFDGEQMEIRADDEEDLTSSPSLRIPGLNFPRRGNNRPDHERRRVPGIDYRLFGSSTSSNNRRNKRPNRFRDRERFRPRDDFGRTTSLHPHRVLPPPNRSRSRNKANRQREVEGREGNPALYIRPPPRPRPRENQPLRQRVHRPPTAPQSREINRQRTRTIDPPVTSTKRPAYSYPRDAMSIQDIISYMTSMSHSNDKTTKKPNLTPTVPEHRTAVWTSSPDYYSNNQRAGQSYPSVLPPPPSMGISRSHDSLPIESHTRGVSSPSNPYTFKLDVYPIRDSQSGGSSSSSSSSSSNYVPPGPSYKQHSVLPPPSYRYRPTSSYPHESRQPSVESSGSLLSDPYNYRRRPQAHGSGSQEQYRYRDNIDDDVDMPLPLAYRPRRPEATTPKPKLVVHLNVFNQKGDRNRYADERRDSVEAEDDYYSPSDIYRAVLRNNAAKTTHHHEGGGDSLMLSGQSRIDTFTQHQMDQNGGGDSSGSSGNSYDNHNMAAASSPTDQYYRSMGTRRSPSSPSSIPAANNAGGNNYRISHQSRNFYPAIDGDVPEPLPIPMAAQQSAGDSQADSTLLTGCLPLPLSGGINCTQGSVRSSAAADRVNKTQTAPLVS